MITGLYEGEIRKSMFISQDKKFIFLHPMKTGGTTTRRRLRIARIRNSGVPNPNREWKAGVQALMIQKHVWHPYHITWESWMTGSNMGLTDYRKFIFVRNPYDRFYSFYLQFWYHIKELIPEAKQNPDHPEAFFKPVSRWYDHPGFKLGSIRYINTPQVQYTHLPAWNSNNSNNKSETNNDLALVRHVDFIGRLENYEEDLNRIAGKLGIAEALRRRGSRIKRNVRNPAPENRGYKYLEHYDQEALDFVNKHWAEDFRYLKYRKIERIDQISETCNLRPYLEDLSDLE